MIKTKNILKTDLTVNIVGQSINQIVETSSNINIFNKLFVGFKK